MGWGAKKNPATGRSAREAVNHRPIDRLTPGGPKRSNGRIVPKGRLEHQRDRKTGKK
jgi:hypothetical protein